MFKSLAAEYKSVNNKMIIRNGAKYDINRLFLK